MILHSVNQVCSSLELHGTGAGGVRLTRPRLALPTKAIVCSVLGRLVDYLSFSDYYERSVCIPFQPLYIMQSLVGLALNGGVQGSSLFGSSSMNWEMEKGK